MPAEASACRLPTGSARRLPVVSLILSLAAVIIYCWPGLTELVQYDGAAIGQGEVWRLLTCQWAHWSFAHLAWDTVMFLVLGAICERMDRKAFLYCVAVSAVLIPLAVAVCHPQVQYYRGLSGVDSALFVMLAVQFISQNLERDRQLSLAAGLALAAFIAKTAYECASGNVLFVQPETAFAPLPLSHVIGGTIGLIIGTSGAGNHQHRLVARYRDEAA
jgi:rhomboid family GlyGly-CTERM serine protease